MVALAVSRLIILLAGIAIVTALASLVTANAFKIGDTFKDCDRCPEMVVVPPGSFRMGDLHGVGYFSEKLIHAVRVDHAFAVGKFEVTFDDARVERDQRHQVPRTRVAGRREVATQGRGA